MASPVHSMTGYGLATREIALTAAADEAPSSFATVSVELRSVNSRFLDINFRSPDECRGFESPLREQLTTAVRRGKVDCRISLLRAEGKGGASALNAAVLQQLQELEKTVAASFPGAGSLRMGEILRWPGLIAEGVLTQDALREAVLACGSEALAQLKESRRREGEALKAVLLERAQAMLAIAARLTPLVPQLVAAHQQKLTERLQEALDATSGNGTATMSRDEIADRIRQEVVMYGIRIDVAEELSRLEAHLKETAHILEKGGPVGKRLDFMMQELNREANTLGSKAAAKELADASMELKLLIEQMREQVQNLE